MKFGVIVFPGSNCALDSYHLVRDVLHEKVEYIRYDQKHLDGFDVIILPGGFTYGDYLRSGALAARTPVMEAVAGFAAAGGLVLGICNGFQVLAEAGLLPGALCRNDSLQFRCRQVLVRVENSSLPVTKRTAEGRVLKMPVAHGDGSYYAPPELLKELENRGQVIFRYVDAEGKVTAKANPNGSVDNIAGVANRHGNVVGMMPHPERAGEKALGSTDGLALFESMIDFCRGREVPGNA